MVYIEDVSTLPISFVIIKNNGEYLNLRTANSFSIGYKFSLVKKLDDATVFYKVDKEKRNLLINYVLGEEKDYHVLPAYETRSVKLGVKDE